ncbi:MAG: type II toxin-antitoxin system Phd/YefM family antitoxin [Bacteroidales bacterium]|nr:type II toxin-antitoxin system Phd/YefM family antitoxin [Clostridium sp.]MCM1204960.1 type II toxin-antitoxin system Phd/YefM family antitoxin [Bacteroidales bacterium]
MPQIIPIKDLKNTSEISEMCHAVSEPIYITKNGYGDMVLMSMETYESQYNREKIYRELEISERQIEEGKILDAKEALDSLRRKYDL